MYKGNINSNIYKYFSKDKNNNNISNNTINN